MSKPEIVKFGNPILREKASYVVGFNKKLRNKVDILKEALFSTPGCAALAAPQLAISKRIVVINYLGEYFELINPEIIETSGNVIDYEGCMSLPGYIGNVERAKTVTVSYKDRHGEEKTVTRSGEMARCFQHEIDHLDGILYTDRLTDDFLTSTRDNSKVNLNDIK